MLYVPADLDGRDWEWNTGLWTHALVRCSTCKRSRARDAHFTLCDKTCDACCLRKRQARSNARRKDRKEKEGRIERSRGLVRRLTESRICSTCKCLRRGVDFERATRKTCMRCLQSRQLRRLRMKRAQHADAAVGATNNFFGVKFPGNGIEG